MSARGVGFPRLGSERLDLRLFKAFQNETPRDSSGVRGVSSSVSLTLTQLLFVDADEFADIEEVELRILKST
jgi:hypothetical protein